MKLWMLLLIIPLIILSACSIFHRQDNPLLKDYGTPFHVPPFEKIKLAHYLPAFKVAMEEQKMNIKAIVENDESPTFENTIEALEYSGLKLTEISNLFFNLNSANTSDAMQEVAKKISPMLSKHGDDIALDPKLFDRVKQVYEKKDDLTLTPEQQMLLQNTYDDFVRGGANLSDDMKNALRAINEELSVLTLQFGEHVLAETNSFKMVIDNAADLAGLPESVRNAAREAAKENGLEGKWLFTLHKPSFIPFLQYSENRPLREKILTAYSMMGDNDNDLDNKKILSRIASLRVKKAKLLGYETHADFVLEKNMAGSPKKVYDFLDELWDAALPVAKKEANLLQKKIHSDGKDFKLKPWDWWYYAEKIRKEKYDLDDEELRPYLELNSVRKGLFQVATNLYGIHFIPREDIPKYHEDVTAYEVEEQDGTHIGILFMDFHPRASKRGGAWMTEYRSQYRIDGKKIYPVISIVMNFSKPTADEPALLSFEEVETLYHEFGHALHGLLSDCTYPSLSGTNVARDFVELPSQIMENWAGHPDVLKMYARHYQTGEPMPEKLINKLKKSRHFNQGFITVEYLAASYLDMDWHTLKTDKPKDVREFENHSMEKINMMPEIIVRYRSPYFQHIFSGGYSAGYYSYIWAEVLDADAFEVFKKKGVFNKETALSFRKNILERGGTEKPMALYKRFRGEEPSIEPLLENRGLK